MRGAFWAVWLLAGCKTSHTLDAASHTDSATDAQIETHETRQVGPEHIVMTVEEFSQLCDRPPEAQPNNPVSERPESDRGRPSGGAPPQLLRRTITVTDRGPSLDDLRSLSSVQTKLNSATTVKTKDTFGFLTGIWPWLLGGGLALAISLLKPAWLGIAWGFVKSLFGRKVS